ncbi:MAG: monovalent cation/H(+) antiporter subunit G [Anaerolineae bacterium]|jgi:multicomponent Na+:H+ antiporter subunit G|nr:monovalent cation/H(+) antiporter subunit G [Anaerolineae bacterium]
MQWVGFVFVVFGLAFTVLGVLGMYTRLTDFYQRTHAAGKVGTLGLLGILVGVAFLQPEVTTKVIVLMIFAILAAPAASNAIAGAAHTANMTCEGGRDDLADYKRSNPEKLDVSNLNG